MMMFNNHNLREDADNINEVNFDNNVINNMEGLYFDYLFEIKNQDGCQNSDFCTAFMIA